MTEYKRQSAKDGKVATIARERRRQLILGSSVSQYPKICVVNNERCDRPNENC